jgi:AcrR family transcriptional regulator
MAPVDSTVNTPTKRRYDASRRREQARMRRRRILEAAQTLFLADGYFATPVAAIAVAAEVSEDLVFRLFGSKCGVLKEVMDVAVGGDDEPTPLLERAGPQAMRACPDQRRQLRLLAAGVTEQLTRLRPLNDLMRSAAAVEPEIAVLRDDVNQRQRRAAMTTVASWIAANGPLRDGMSTDDAGAVIWTLASPEVHRALTLDCGWSGERFRDWLCHTLIASLLPDAAEPSPEAISRPRTARK